MDGHGHASQYNNLLHIRQSLGWRRRGELELPPPRAGRCRARVVRRLTVVAKRQVRSRRSLTNACARHAGACSAIRAGTWCIVAVSGALLQSGCAPEMPRAERITLAGPNADGLDWLEHVSSAYVRLLILGERLDDSKGRGGAHLGIVNGASGTIVDARGYIITAAHIATSADLQARATTLDGRAHEAAILHVSPERELALLKIEPLPGLTAAQLAQEDSVREGDRVFAIGTPDNVAGVVTSGRVRQPRRPGPVRYGRYGFSDAIELSIDVSPGFSGGPVFDRNGEMIGMMAGFGLGDTSRVPYASPSLGYAVPASAIRAYLAEVIRVAEDPGQE